MDPGSAFVVGIDPATGATKFSVEIPHQGFIEGSQMPIWEDTLIVGGDGYAYLTYAWASFSQQLAPYALYHLGLMRVNSSGVSDSSEVYSALGSVEVPSFGSRLISNGDTGVLLSFRPDFGPPLTHLAISTGTSVSQIATLALPDDPYFVPVLQTQNGWFVGSVDGGNQFDMVAFNANGSVRWMVPNESPQMATADGGVIGESGITYDQYGNAIGRIHPATQSWTGNEYTSAGSVSSRDSPPVFPEGSGFWSIAGGNPSGNGTAFAQCPCLLQSAGVPPLQGADFATGTLASAPNTGRMQADPPSPKTYVILEGDPGLNLPGHMPHNVGNLFHLAAGTEQDRLNGLGNLAGSPIRVSSVQAFANQLTGNGPITGGVVFFGHGAGRQSADGTWSSILAPGEQAGADTNISAANVNLLSNAQLDTAVTITLHACYAGFGSRRYSIAQLIANRLQRRVYAPAAGTFFSVDPNAKYTGANAPPLPNSKPMYLLQDGGRPFGAFLPSLTQ